jgi:hypothetical protein
LDPISAAMRAKPQVSSSESVNLGEEGESFSLQEAIAQGLIPPDLLRGMDKAAEQGASSSEVDTEPEPEAEPLNAKQKEVPAEEPEAKPVAIAEITVEEGQTDSVFPGFGLQEAIARGLIDPVLLGLEDTETQDEDA